MRNRHSNGVRAKKSLGQHFLTDQAVASNIVNALSALSGNALEIGPGMGVLTKYLLEREGIDFRVVEIDRESVTYLKEHFPSLCSIAQSADPLHRHIRIYDEDFLKLDLHSLFGDKFSIIGNFPYNISSQIFFKVIENRDYVDEVVCMVQKEVAERIATQDGSKTYGILSVLLQAWYDIEYLFTVGEGAFVPPPKVKSAVIRLTRNGRTDLGCDEVLFKQVVKTSFNQRRKTLRNSLKTMNENGDDLAGFSSLRPEQLSITEFIELTRLLSTQSHS